MAEPQIERRVEQVGNPVEFTRASFRYGTLSGTLPMCVAEIRTRSKSACVKVTTLSSYLTATEALALASALQMAVDWIAEETAEVKE